MKNLEHFKLTFIEGDDFKVKTHMMALIGSAQNELSETMSAVQGLERANDAKSQELERTSSALGSWENKFKALEIQHTRTIQEVEAMHRQ